MKKLLFLSAVLAISASVFAGEEERGGCRGDACSAKIDLPIRAEVCWPITILRAKGLDFGTIQGNSNADTVLNPMSPRAGLVSIAGEKGRNIKVGVDDEVKLLGPGGHELKVDPILVLEDLFETPYEEDFVMVIDDFGNYAGKDFLGVEVIKVGGKIPGGQYPKPGTYVGFTHLTFKYE